MRKIAVFFILTSLPLFAEPSAREMAKNLGYQQELLNLLPDKHLPRAPLVKDNDSSIKPFSTKQIGEDVLSPRLYQKPEPLKLIPFLVSLQKKQPASAKITRKIALTYLQAGQPKEALYWFIQTYHRDKNDLSALWNIATLSYRTGDIRAAGDYLKEYARVDPYSAWGKIARQFIEAGKFGGVELSSGFEKETPHVALFGAPGSGSSGKESSLMVIDGRVTTPEDFGHPPNEFPVENPLNPSQKKSSDKEKKEDKEKSDSKNPLNTKTDKQKQLDDKTDASNQKAPLTKAIIDTIPSKTPSREATAVATPTTQIASTTSETASSTAKPK